MKKEFFSEFLKQGSNIGSVTPSSKHLVAKMLEPISFEGTQCLVEFGPGTGIITLELLERMPKDAKLLVFEINKEFCEILSEIKDDRLIVITDSAENIDIELNKHGFKKADYIISSLPLTLIPNNTIEIILNKVKTNLKLGGKFIQYQYTPTSYRKLKNIFNKVRLDFVVINFPPAFIFICKN